MDYEVDEPVHFVKCLCCQVILQCGFMDKEICPSPCGIQAVAIFTVACISGKYLLAMKLQAVSMKNHHCYDEF